MSDVGRYRKVYARLWRHPGFVDLTEGEKVLALYLLTGPQTNRIGLYMFSVATAAEDLGTVPQTLMKRLLRVCETLGWLFDARARVFYIPSWWRWNAPDNINVVKGSLRDLNEIPPCGLVDTFARNIESVPETLRETFFKQLRQRLPNRMSTQEQDQDQDQDQDTALRAKAALKDDKRKIEKDKEKNKRTDGSERSPELQGAIVGIAKAVIRESGHAADSDYLIDAVIFNCRAQAKLEIDRQTAIRALAAASPTSGASVS